MTMGNSVSKSTVSEKVIHKPDLKRQVMEDDYVDLGNEGEKAYRNGRLVREPEGLPFQLTQSWQSSFLGNPKNRYYYDSGE